MTGLFASYIRTYTGLDRHILPWEMNLLSEKVLVKPSASQTQCGLSMYIKVRVENTLHSHCYEASPVVESLDPA